jgi:HK97 gp10 family phage protein
MTEANLQREIARINEILYGLSKNVKKERHGILRKAAKPLVQAAQDRAPVSDFPHRRYAKHSGPKAGKGHGQVVATYEPLNLENSLQVMTFSRSQAVFVGPKISKGGGDRFGPSSGKYDPYYAHMVEYGTSKTPAKPFMRPAWAQMEGPVTRDVLERFKRLVNEYAQTYKR